MTPAPPSRLTHAMQTEDPDWLAWARELQAIAQTGLTFNRDPYDRERYEAVRGLATRMLAALGDAPGEYVRMKA